MLKCVTPEGFKAKSFVQISSLHVTLFSFHMLKFTIKRDNGQTRERFVILWFSWQYLGLNPSAFCDFWRSVFSCCEPNQRTPTKTRGVIWQKKTTNRCNITGQAATLAYRMFKLTIPLLTWTLDYPAGTEVIVRTFHTCKNLLFITLGSEESDKTSNLPIYSSQQTSWIVHEATHPTDASPTFLFFFSSFSLKGLFMGFVDDTLIFEFLKTQ